MEESETYHKITQESEDVYSTDYGWGLYKDDDNSSAKSSKYRRTYTGNERNQLISSVDSSYSTAYVYGQDGQRSYYGVRYLDPKYSMWISTDPALGEYIPIAPTNDEAKKAQLKFARNGRRIQPHQFQFVPLRRKQPGEVYRPGWKGCLLN